jgi:hypothetical protein
MTKVKKENEDVLLERESKIQKLSESVTKLQ